VAGETDYQATARALARAEAIQFRSILLGFGLVDQWMAAVSNPAPAGPGLRYSAETRLAIEREDRTWARCTRPTDSDWGVFHAPLDERSK